jgi:hypothetical protein
LSKDFSHEAVREAVRCGTELVRQAGGWLAAIMAFKTAWEAEHPNHLRGVQAPGLDGRIAPSLLQYLREVGNEGVSLRRENPGVRARAKPHLSAADYQEEAFAQMWDDARCGRILLCYAEEPGLQGVVSSPQGRVPKMNPDRSLAEEGRFITDMREANLACPKENFPPAGQPKHQEVAREILWWKVRAPRIPVLLAKRDVKAAFKLLWLRPEDSALMSIELLGRHVGLDHDVAVLYRCMNFGWSGAPGEWMAWAWGLKQFTESCAPPDPGTQGTSRYRVFLLMDDAVFVEPLLGTRPWAATGGPSPAPGVRSPERQEASRGGLLRDESADLGAAVRHCSTTQLPAPAHYPRISC